jgi:hypothetical protein
MQVQIDDVRRFGFKVWISTGQVALQRLNRGHRNPSSSQLLHRLISISRSSLLVYVVDTEILVLKKYIGVRVVLPVTLTES